MAAFHGLASAGILEIKLWRFPKMVDPRIIQITVDRLSIETHGFEDLWKTPNQDMNHPQISALPLQPRSREHENTFQKSSGSLQNMTRPMTTTTTKKTTTTMTIMISMMMMMMRMVVMMMMTTLVLT
jgi:hypothetical protein